MNDNANMAQRYEREIPEGYEARIEGNKIIIELKETESEDERTRKEIIDWMKGGNTYDWQENKEKWIAYLEKQKEQKESVTTEWPNLSNCLKNCKKCKAKCFYRKEAYLAPEHDCGKDDWLRRELLEYLTVTREGDLVGRPERQRWVTWLESIRPKPEQEWGEEDKEMLEEIIHSVNGYDAITGTIPQNFEQHERKINWLKSLRPQSKQEWSEEEERHLYNAIEAVKYVYDISEGTNGFKCIEFLKSFRPQPHWKPSKEQMTVLEDVITMKRGNEHETTMLRTLYDDLKKL